MTAAFISASGQDDNVGDSVLRRGLIRVIRPLGPLHIFVGDASDSYVTGLGLDGNETLYRSRASWRRALVGASVRRRSALVFNAGEIAPGPRNAVGRVLGAADALVVRASGGSAVHTGAGVRRAPGIWRFAIGPGVALSSVVTWRDAVSAGYFDDRDVAPDWAFSEGTATTDWNGTRNLLAITMRGDRPEPSSAWLDAVARVASERGLTPVVTVQVARDSTRSEWIASRLGADIVPFLDVTHAQQESVVRRLYASSSLVVSDRLHALVFGATEGAIPVGYATGSAEKLERTLAPVGLAGNALAGDLPVAAAVDRVIALAGSGGLARAVDDARARLDDLGERIRGALDRRQ